VEAEVVGAMMKEDIKEGRIRLHYGQGTKMRQ